MSSYYIVTVKYVSTIYCAVIKVCINIGLFHTSPFTSCFEEVALFVDWFILLLEIDTQIDKLTVSLLPTLCLRFQELLLHFV